MSQDYLQSKDYSVGTILTDFRPFYIPIFQRPYSWTKVECQKLWEDVVEFFLGKTPYKFQLADAPKYFLGALVVYQDGPDETKRMAVIDGQQRITTLMLLLKAFYDAIDPITNRQDSEQQRQKDVLERLEKSLWVQEWDDARDENVPMLDKPILSSDAIDDENSKGDFTKIITTKGLSPSTLAGGNPESAYVSNYLEMKALIDKAFAVGGELAKIPMWRLVNSILDHCTFLFIKSNKEEDALRIFNTLNNRGMQLLDADILKSQIYAVTTDKTAFKDEWATFSILARRAKAIQTSVNQPQDEMFRMLMMYVKATKSNAANDIQLRAYFEKKAEGGSVITDRLLADVMIPLTAFFAAMSARVKVSDDESEDIEPVAVPEWIDQMGLLISDEAAKWLQVVSSFSKNTYWRHMISVFFVRHWNDSDFDVKFEKLLRKAVAFNILYLIYDVPFTNIRKKAYNLILEVYNNGDFVSEGLLSWSAEDSIQFDKDAFSARVEELRIKPNFSRALTLLHAYLNPDQHQLIPVDAQVEHVFPRSWEKHVSAHDRGVGIYGVTDEDISRKYVEKFGNKVMCEAALNNGAKDKYFDFKAGVYQGAFSSKYKGAIQVDESGIRTPVVPENPKNRAKAKASAIADVQSICKNLIWGKSQIDARDQEVKQTLFKFFKDTLGL